MKKVCRAERKTTKFLYLGYRSELTIYEDSTSSVSWQTGDRISYYELLRVAARKAVFRLGRISTTHF